MLKWSAIYVPMVALAISKGKILAPIAIWKFIDTGRAFPKHVGMVCLACV
jgi:hypothetical protein